MLDDLVLFKLETEINRIYAQVETEMVSAIAHELAKGANASASPILWRTEKLRQMGRLEGKLSTVLAKKSRDIQSDLEDSIIRAMLGAGKEDDMVLKQIASVKAQIEAGTFVEASKSTVFRQMTEAAVKNARMGLNLTNTRALQSASQMWVSVVNTAYVKTLTGSTSLDQAVKLSVREMGRQGAYVTYVSDMGRVTKTSLEVAVRRDVVTSVNQAASEMTMGRCDEYECDLVEVSAHEGARPEHAAWQGKVYSLHGKTPGYELLTVATGYGTVEGLAGANCKHSMAPYFPGLSKSNNDSHLSSKENKKVYESVQKQRYYERQIRNAKREEAVLKAAGMESKDAHNRVLDYQSKMRYYIEESGLTRQYGREQIHAI